MMKRQAIALTLSAVLSAGCLTGCAGSVQSPASDRIQIVCTNFAVYDWTRNLLAPDADYDVTYLLKNGTDSHSFQPSAADIAKISSCDLFIYVGGESEHWTAEAVQNVVNPDHHSLRLLDVVPPLEEELVEGMEAEEEEGDEVSDEPEYDEHIWLSVQNAQLCCSAIDELLCEVDPAHADAYQDAGKHYQERLAKLDTEFAAVAEQNHDQPLIVADRFPFRYFVEDYGYTYYAAFAGCSAETEASFETVAFLANKADECQTRTLFTIEGGNTGIAEAVRDNTQSKDQTIAVLNSLQSVTQEQIEGGASYCSLMEENLAVLKEAAERS